MNTRPGLENRETQPVHPGVWANRCGGYTVHLKLDDRVLPVLSSPKTADELAPVNAPTLASIIVYEDCVVLALKDGRSILLHVSDPGANGTVLRIYHSNGMLWRVIALEQLNGGWVSSRYVFRSDLRKLTQRLARIRHHPARPTHHRRPTFWATGGWSEAVIFTATALVWRMQEWQHSTLTDPQVVTPEESQVQTWSEYPADVQMLLTLQESGVQKTTYQLGGLTLVLTYIERIGLAQIVDRHCPREGGISEGTVMTVLTVNRLLAPCALGRIAQWVEETGLHLLLGISDPKLLNYHRLADTLQAVFPHWQAIAAQVTLKAVAQFGLQVQTVHYDLTSVCFCGQYTGSSWVEFGYSRDHRPDRKQVNLGLSTTADGEVVLPGASGIHSGNTGDASTTVSNHQKLRTLFERSDILVTGDRIMQSAENMLTIARAHGRFLGPVDWTPSLRNLVARCPESAFQTLPDSSARRGYPLKAISRRVWFKHKEPLSEAARKRLKTWRRKHHIRGALPKYREVRFWMHAAIVLDTARQASDARLRERRLRAYEAELAFTQAHLGRGRFYGDPEWVAHHLVDLECDHKQVRDLLCVTFTHKEGQMELTYHRQPKRIAQAARLDGKWVLVTNQPLERGQSPVTFMDWMVSVYHNHRHVERRMRNLKSDLPIRPLYVHRDDEVVALCFVSLLALTLYTLIERDVQADPELVSKGLRTTDAVLSAMSGWALSACHTPSGYICSWFDTLTLIQQLIVQRLRLIDPATRVPGICQAGYNGDTIAFDASSASFLPTLSTWAAHNNRLSTFLMDDFYLVSAAIWAFFAIVKVLFVMLCWKSNQQGEKNDSKLCR
jgi:transposase